MPESFSNTLLTRVLITSMPALWMYVCQSYLHTLCEPFTKFLCNQRVIDARVRILPLKVPSHTLLMISGGWCGSTRSSVSSCCAKLKKNNRYVHSRAGLLLYQKKISHPSSTIILVWLSLFQKLVLKLMQSGQPSI